MTDKIDILAANSESYAELRALAARLTEADLAHDLGHGWTVAAMLAHIAFYDFRAAALLDRWRETGVVQASPLDADMMNAAGQQLLLAIPTQQAVALALAAAEAADQHVAAVDNDFMDRIEAAGGPAAVLQRSGHRRNHIGQIVAWLRK